MNLKNDKSQDRRLKVFRAKIESLEKENDNLRKENTSLRVRIEKYESVISQVKEAEQRYNDAIADARSLALKYSEAVSDFQELRRNYKSEMRTLMNRIKR